MSYIMPNGELRILQGIPFENNYEHTILFDDETDQANYFIDKTKVYADPPGIDHLVYQTNHTYQRVNSNKIRLGQPIERVINCNYLMFRNDAFENKWFYAFITQFDYINNNVTEISYEIDVIQTYMFDYSLQECYVEREHSATDNPGDNTVPENLEIGECIYTSEGKTFQDLETDFSIDIVAPYRLDYIGGAHMNQKFNVIKNISNGFYNNLFSGIHHNIFKISNNFDDDPSFFDIEVALGELSDEHKENIIAIYTIPDMLIASKNNMPNGVNGLSKTINKNYSWTYNGTEIKNKKLYTYPFNYLHIQSSDGESQDYKYELFSTNNCVFNYYGVMGVPPELMCCPVGYASGTPVGSSLHENEYINILSVKKFPMSGWNTDGFKAWLTQTATSLIGGLIGVGLAPKIGEVMNAEISKFTKMSFAANVYGSIAGLPRAALLSNYAHGQESNNMMLALNNFGFHFYNVHIKPEYAAIIDDYFNKFGYATKRVKKPNIKSRPFWNYIETKNCNINQYIYEGSRLVKKGLNTGDTKKISDIYDHGITFWHYNDGNVDVGNYDQNNAPSGQG